MEQLVKFESLGLPDKYYEVCDQHTMRIGEPIEKMPFKEVLKAAEGKIELNKLKGPGTGFEVLADLWFDGTCDETKRRLVGSKKLSGL